MMTDQERAEHERESFEHKRRVEAERLGKEISGFINRGGDTRALVEELLNDHPTLQQRFMRGVVKAYLEGMAANTYVDARNEGSREYARKAVEATKEVYLPFI